MQCRVPRKNKRLETVTVTLSGTFDSTYAYVTIGGKTYTSAQTLTVEKGTGVTVVTYGSGSGGGLNAVIQLNGTKVGNSTTYVFAVTDNCKIVGDIKTDASATGTTGYGRVSITMPYTG